MFRYLYTRSHSGLQTFSDQGSPPSRARQSSLGAVPEAPRHDACNLSLETLKPETESREQVCKNRT